MLIFGGVEWVHGSRLEPIVSTSVSFSETQKFQLKSSFHAQIAIAQNIVDLPKALETSKFSEDFVQISYSSDSLAPATIFAPGVALMTWHLRCQAQDCLLCHPVIA